MNFEDQLISDHAVIKMSGVEEPTPPTADVAEATEVDMAGDAASKGQVLGAGSQQVVRYAERNFTTFDEITSYVDSIEPADRYGMQRAILEMMVAQHDKWAEQIERMFAYMQGSGSYKGVMTEEEFLESWSEVLLTIQNNKKKRNRLAEAKRKVLKSWSGDKAVKWVEQLHESATFMSALRQLAGERGYDQAVRQINQCVVARLRRPKRGVSTAKNVLTGDVDDARKCVEGEPVLASELAELGMRIGRFGIVEKDDGTILSLEADNGAPEENRAQLPETPVVGGSEDLSRPAGEITAARASRRGKLTTAEANEFQVPEPECEDIDEDAIESAEDDLDAWSVRAGTAEKYDSENEEEGEEEHPVKRRKTGACKCSRDVTEGWKSMVMKKRALGLVTDMKLLARHQSFRRVCYAHSKALGGHLGLMLRTLSKDQLAARLAAVHESRLALGRLKTDTKTYWWFRVANRPTRPSDSLGPYRFAPSTQQEAYVYDQAAILAYFSKDLGEVWERDGTVKVDVFSWWFEGVIGDIITAEFDMYRHHLRKINGKSNYGWLRNMFYSVGQQLMRQDPVYYMLYVALRPDKQWRLITYPYYAKYAVEGDQTYFRHLDLNIPELVANGRGAAMIQGSVSIDDEDEESCTILIPGMQHKLGEWWARCKVRGQETDGFVHRITEQMFTEEDADVLGLNWRRDPCRRGEVRVTAPHLPHGSDGPATKVRRTMLPWFVGVQEDGENLEVIEGGSWSELARAHRDLVSPNATPSGLANRYGAIPYRFPAAVEVGGLGALSDALVCRRRWDSPMVLRDRDVLLGGSASEIGVYVQQWRARAEKAALEAFEVVKEEERRAFGPKSYFYHLERLESLGIPLPDVSEDEEEMDLEEVAQDRTVAMDFAEAGEDLGE